MPKDKSYFEDDFSFSSDDDDDAPTEFSTSNIRKNKLSQDRSLKLQEKEAKEKIKQKRRKRDEMFKAQKEQKLERYGKKALPADVLEAVANKKPKVQEGIDASDGEDKEEDDQDRLGGSEFGDDDFDDMALDLKDDNFISLESETNENGVKVVTVEAPKRNKTSMEKALAFKECHLYTARGTAPQRETANQRKNRMMKKKQLRAVK